jgi:peptidoglycan/xylan/chitin deacetylase (PgdA/CDA1 family)
MSELGIIMQSLISLTFDDGLRCQFERAVPILADYGILATFFLTANRDQTHEPWYGHTEDWWKIDWREEDIAYLRKLIRDGHEIGSHSLTHHQEKMQSNPMAEARESKELIEGWLDTKVTSFCYPYYSSHNYLGDAVKAAGYEGAKASYYDIHGGRSFDRFNIDCRQVSAEETASKWVQPGCWQTVTFHAIGNERDGWGPISEGRFSKLIAELAGYRDQGMLEILPFRSAVARLQ